MVDTAVADAVAAEVEPRPVAGERPGAAVVGEAVEAAARAEGPAGIVAGAVAGAAAGQAPTAAAVAPAAGFVVVSPGNTGSQSSMAGHLFRSSGKPS